MKNKTKKINNKTHTYSFAKAKYSRFPPKNTKKQFLFRATRILNADFHQ